MLMKGAIDLFSVSSAALTTIGGFFLVRSVVQSGPKEMASMSGTYLGGNPHLQSALVQQKADTIIGFVLILVGGLLGMLAAFASFEVSAGIRSVAGIAFLGITLFYFAHLAAKKIRRALALKTSAISFGFHVSSYLKRDKIDAQKLIVDAKSYGLASLVKESMCPYENIAEILRYAGASPGASHVLELKKRTP